MTAFFIFVMAISYSWYFQDGEILKFCIHIPASQEHDFAVGEHNACLIDWWPFMQEALAFPVMAYLAALMPAVIFLYKYRPK